LDSLFSFPLDWHAVV